MTDELNKERLGKIVALAKHGIGGEKENAIRFVKSICKKHGLNFDEVMGAGDEVTEWYIEHKRGMARLLAQVIVTYAYDGDGTLPISPSRGHTRMYFNATKAKYVETAHAWAVLSRLYDKEQKRMKDALYHAFLSKHELYATKVVKSVEEKELTEDEKRARQMGGALARGLEDAEILKTLGDGKTNI